MKNRVVALVFGLLFGGLLLSLFLACSFGFPLVGDAGWSSKDPRIIDWDWDTDARWEATGTGHVTVQGGTYTLTKLHFVDYGEWDTGVYNVNLYMMSEWLDRGVYSGVGETVFLEMYFDTPSVFSGNYNRSTITNPGRTGTFLSTSRIRIRYWPHTNSSEGNYQMNGDGHVDISIDGPECTINGDVAVGFPSPYVNATFSFNGRLTGDVLPTALKHQR